MNIEELKTISVTSSEHFFELVTQLVKEEGYLWVTHIEWMEQTGLTYYFVHPEMSHPLLVNVASVLCERNWPSLARQFRALGGIEDLINARGGPFFQKESWTSRYEWPAKRELPGLGHVIHGHDFRSQGRPLEGGEHWFQTLGTNDLFAGHFCFQLEGESEAVTRARFDRGSYKTGELAKLGDFSWRQILNQTDGLSPNAPYFINLALIESLEDHLGVSIPERAGAIRMVLCELSRIYEHVQSLHQFFLLYGVRAWEQSFLELGIEAFQLLKRYGRGEWTGQLNTVGGVRYDLPDDWKNQLLIFISVMMKALDGSKGTLERSPGLISSLSKIKMNLSDVMSHTLTGPVARACGLRRDLRKLTPRYFYHEVEFDIALGIRSSFYDVVLVKLEEIRQSVSILAQLLDGLPFDSIQSPEYSLLWNPPEYEVLSAPEREQVVGALKEGITLLKGGGMGAVETARGELVLIWREEGAQQRGRQISVISPSRQLSYFLEKRAVGLSVREIYSMCALAHLCPQEMEL